MRQWALMLALRASLRPQRYERCPISKTKKAPDKMRRASSYTGCSARRDRLPEYG